MLFIFDARKMLKEARKKRASLESLTEEKLEALAELGFINEKIISVKKKRKAEAIGLAVIAATVYLSISFANYLLKHLF